MAKAKTVFYCTACGHESPKWVGRCPGCGAWNTMEEQPVVKTAGGRMVAAKAAVKPVPLSKVDVTPAGHCETGIEELDRVLGGGLIEGAVVLVGGEPGWGNPPCCYRHAKELHGRGKRCCMFREKNPLGRLNCGQRAWARCAKIFWCWRKRTWTW